MPGVVRMRTSCVQLQGVCRDTLATPGGVAVLLAVAFTSSSSIFLVLNCISCLATGEKLACAAAARQGFKFVNVQRVISCGRQLLRVLARSVLFVPSLWLLATRFPSALHADATGQCVLECGAWIEVPPV